MLSYQHAYHAGGPADVHKHAVLLALLRVLTAKDRPLTYLETHAGRGVYDLSGDEAARTGEAAAGIARLRQAAGDGAVDHGIVDYLRVVGPGPAYPGSPLVAARVLRPTDLIHLMERHPAEHAALVAALEDDRRVGVQFRDGYEGVRALVPPKPRRGLLLIDPSYEVKTEYADLAPFCADVLAAWPEAVIATWYPMLAAERHRAMVHDLMALGGDAAWLSEMPLRPIRPGHGLLGSGVVVLNPPWGFADRIGPTLGALADVFAS